MARQEVTGSAAVTRLTADMASGASSFSVNDATGWPTGAHPFVATIDRGSGTEEKILCASRTGNTITTATRGYDGTAPLFHPTGTMVEHTISAVIIDEANDHVNTPGRDDHTNYLRTSDAGAGLGVVGRTISIPNDAVLNTMLANMANATVKGRNTAGTGDPEDVTMAQLKVLLSLGALAFKAQSTVIADFAANLRPWQIVTSSTRPGSPSAGDAIYETDTNRIYVWNGTQWNPLSGAYSTNTGPAWTAGTSYTQFSNDLTLPAGNWLLRAKARFATSTSVPRSVFAEIYNNTDGVQLDESADSPPAVTGDSTIPLFAKWSIAATKIIRVRAKVSAIDGTQAGSSVYLEAVPQSVIS